MDPRYPIGRFSPPGEFTPALRSEWIRQIGALPVELRRTVAPFSDGQLDTPYRDGGWTVRQVVHHLPDSHINAYVRFRLALTEDRPTIKPYEEAMWAELTDARSAPIAPSLDLLAGLHDRWIRLMAGMRTEEFARTFLHPEWGEVTLDHTLALYAWHGRHHTAHITALEERLGWR